MTITKTPPFRLPSGIFMPFKDKTRNKCLAKGAGLEVEIIGKNTTHLTFEVALVFNEIDKRPLFENVSAEMQRWWPSAMEILDINSQVFCGHLMNVKTLEKFIVDHLQIEVDLDTEEGEVIFHLHFEVESPGGSCEINRSSKISLKRLQSWIGDIE